MTTPGVSELPDVSVVTPCLNGMPYLRDAVASVEVAGSGFAVGEPLPIRWQNGPGNRNDWLAVFRADVPSEYQNQLAWGYVGARPSGAIEMSASTTEENWPIPTGRYVVRLLKDDGFEVLAESSPFTVE